MNALSADIMSWTRNRIIRDQIKKYMDGDRDFIPDGEIERKLKDNLTPDPGRIRDILRKSLSIETLSPDETAALLNATDDGLWQEIEQAAARVKKKVYDNRIVTFAPLYLGNLCVNNCLYCGFRRGNTAAERKILDMDEVKREIETLAGRIGHKRLIVVYGEHPRTGVDYMVSTIKTIYSVKVATRGGFGQIRRVNVNAAPLSVEELKRLREAGIGTYQVFQETYHRGTYQSVHPPGTVKSDYLWRLYCMHRAFEAGVDDVGIGVLFGLYDWRFEVMGLVYHSRELERRFGVGPHTISFPRLEPAHNVPFTQNPAFKVNDADFRKLITVIRLAIPYTGMILTARESASLRRESIPLGITQIDASSRIGIGAYSDSYENQRGERQQFFLGDTRSLEQVIRELAEMGYITSFCTAGYRCGRTGKKIMDLLRSGDEGKFCKLNAILTFREWLDDFADSGTQKVGEELITEELEQVKQRMPERYHHLIKNYERIRNGERDIYF